MAARKSKSKSSGDDLIALQIQPSPCLDKEALSAAPPVPQNKAQDELVAKLGWAIANPTRVRILRILLARKACICGELVDQIPLAQSTISQHLKILKSTGLIVGETDGPKVCYCVNLALLKKLKQLIADF